MLKNLRHLGIFLTLGLLMASCKVYRLPEPVLEEIVTPQPKVKATLAALESQSGNTDVIVILGILVCTVIVIPILLQYKEWRLS
jgi:hypothetical protein